MRQHSGKKGRAVRRGWALVLCAGAIWMLTGGGVLDSLRQRVEDWQLDTRLLAAQLNSMEEEDSLDSWSQVAVDASPLLASSAAAPVEETAAPTLEPTPEPEETPAETAAPEPTPEPAPEPQVEEVTLSDAIGANAVSLADVALTNNAGVSVDLEAVAAMGVHLNVYPDEPQILIMHTHGSEAYTPEGEDYYDSSDNYRTTDNNYNMIRVGEEMKAVFEEMGFSVIHDTTLYDYPSYTGSYARSLEGIQAYLEEYPSICMVLDVHRDALIDEDGTAYKVVTTVGEEKTAQVMLVVGTDAGGLYHPNWAENLALGVQIQETLLSIEPTLPRAINLRSSRFNQHMTAGSLLVEVGSCGNTLQEAIRGGRLFAQAAGAVLQQQMAGEG